MPPYLAGRESEQTLFRELLTDLSNGFPPDSEVVLHGPRGNGKTALLGWLEAEAASFPSVEVVHRTPSEVPDRARLAEELLPESWWERVAPSEVSVGGMTWRPGQARPPSARALLSVRAARAPLVLLLDEAHTLDPAVGRELLNASQQVGRRMPFLLVVAGTPNLASQLGAMNASFWNRAEQVRIGRLTASAAGEAFLRPLGEAGIGVSEDALAAMVRESQCYPYFVQLLGRAVWRAARLSEARREVTLETVAAARPDFDRTRDAYYRHRYQELTRRRRLGVGQAVAEAFRGRSALHDLELASVIEQSLGAPDDPERVEQARDDLCELGYLWGSETRPEWEPGIPSLMDYIRESGPTS